MPGIEGFSINTSWFLLSREVWRSLQFVFCGSCCSVAKLFLILCSLMDWSVPGFPVLHYLLEFAQTMSVELVKPSSHLILCQPLFLMPSVFPSIRIFSSESAPQVRWPKYWSFSFSINIQGWFPLGLTGLISLLSKELSRVFSNTMVRKHQFFGVQPALMVQLSHPYITAGKTITLTIQTFVSKVMSLLLKYAV